MGRCQRHGGFWRPLQLVGRSTAWMPARHRGSRIACEDLRGRRRARTRHPTSQRQCLSSLMAEIAPNQPGRKRQWTFRQSHRLAHRRLHRFFHLLAGSVRPQVVSPHEFCKRFLERHQTHLMVVDMCDLLRGPSTQVKQCDSSCPTLVFSANRAYSARFYLISATPVVICVGLGLPGLTCPHPPQHPWPAPARNRTGRTRCSR